MAGAGGQEVMTDTEQKVWIIGVCEDDPSDMKEVCQMISREMQERAVLRRYGTTEELFADLNTGKRDRLDILYLDIIFPGENGMAAAEQIKAGQPGGDPGISGARDASEKRGEKAQAVCSDKL